MRLLHWHKNTVLIGVSMLAVLGVGEVLARLLWNPGGYRPIIQADPVYGWSLTPGVLARSVDTDRRLHYDVEINSLGWRDPEPPGSKQRDTKRLLILGDSMVFGAGVQYGERFGDVLQRALGDDVEVINAAVTGWGTDQQYLYLVHEGFDLDPDAVVLGLCLGNDVTNNMLGHNLFGVAPKPRFELAGGKLVHVPPRERPPPSTSRRLGRALQRSRLLHYVGRHIRILRARARRAPAPTPAMPYNPENLAADESQWSVYRTEYSPRFEAAFQVTEALITAMHDSCAARRVPFLVFAFPLKVETDPRARAREMAHFGFSSDWFDMDKPYRRIAALCEQRGCPLIYPIEVFRDRAAQAPLFLARDPHPNPAGHALAAESVLPEVEAALRLPIRPARR